MINKNNIPNKQQGFTIVELLIATTVFSVILLLVTLMIVSINNLYVKGLNQARVQGNVRDIIDEVSSKIQNSDSAGISGLQTSPDGTTKAYCIGNVRYSFVLDRQISATPSAAQTRHVVWRDKVAVGGCSISNGFLNSATPSVGGIELIAPNSRLSEFSISSTSPYAITVGVAYGDDDLLCDSGTAGDCSSTTASTHIVVPSRVGELFCKGKSGQQFCAAAKLKIIVVNRL